MKKIAPLLLLFFLAGNVSAQDPVFVAKTSGTQVAQHAVFTVQFELKNATSTRFEPPSFKDFKIVGGPSTSSSTMIVNGVVSKSQTWTYSILANKQGKQTVEAAKVIIGNQGYSTKPFQVEVLASTAQSNQGSVGESKDPIFLRAELNDSIYYPGQQIILNYKLLFNENVQTVNPIVEDDYTDFFLQHFANINPVASYETINGVQYTSRVIKSLALYAHQSGTYEIDPLVIQAGIDSPFETNRGFFSMRRLQHVQIASLPISVQVDPLPSDATDTFSGAVGQYQMRVTQGQQQLSTNDAFTFYLEITGNGDSRRWALPSPVTNGKFDIYEPKIIKDEEFEMNNQMNQRRTISYQMIPSSSGTFKISVPFTYFDPETKAYVTAHSDTMTVMVTQGQKKDHTATSDSDESTAPVLMSVSKPWFKDQFWTSIPHLFLFGLFVSGFGFGLFGIWRYEREHKIPEAQRISRDAGQKANDKFDQLEKSMDGMDVRAFYGSATEIFYAFLIERFSIPSSELDEAGVASYLTKSNIEESLVNRTKSFFVQCLTVRYGGTPEGMSRTEMIQVCRDLINGLQD